MRGRICMCSPGVADGASEISLATLPVRLTVNFIGLADPFGAQCPSEMI